jgi:acyl-CoA dehydrogenase
MAEVYEEQMVKSPPPEKLAAVAEAQVAFMKSVGKTEKLSVEVRDALRGFTPAESLIGQEGKGFSYILDGMNAERILVASDSLGDARWFIEKAVGYVGQRVIFGKPIGANQGVQFPIAKAHVSIEAADLMRTKAARMFDAGIPCGGEANMAKYLAAEAAWEAGNACIDCHGGYGYAEEYDVERKFRESRLYRAAPINNNLVLAFVGEHVLGMPRSY